MYPSVETLSEIAPLTLSLPARASACAGAEERRRREPVSCAVASVDCRWFSLPIGRESTFAVDTRPIGRPKEAGFDQSRLSGIYAGASMFKSRNTCKWYTSLYDGYIYQLIRESHACRTVGTEWNSPIQIQEK